MVSYTRSDEQKNHELNCVGTFLCLTTQVHGQGKPNELLIYLINEDSHSNQGHGLKAVLEAPQ